MTKDNLIRANALAAEICDLEQFIHTSEKVWAGKLIHQKHSFIFQSCSYGILKPIEYPLDNEMKNKVLNILKEHLTELKLELENI